jgi:hypothetical protein
VAAHLEPPCLSFTQLAALGNGKSGMASPTGFVPGWIVKIRDEWPSAA